MDTRISPKTSALVAIITAILTVLGPPAAAHPPGDIIEYPVPTRDFGGPSAITAGPDGALWFTEVLVTSGPEIGRASCRERV